MDVLGVHTYALHWRHWNWTSTSEHLKNRERFGGRQRLEVLQTSKVSKCSKSSTLAVLKAQQANFQTNKQN